MLRFITVTLALFLVNGCKKAQEGAGTKPVTLQVVFWGNAEHRKIQKEISALFEQKYPRIKIKEEPGNWPYLEPLLVRIAGNNAPDVFKINESMFMDLMLRGALTNLDPYIAEDREFDLKGIPEKLTDSYKYEGHTYALPHEFYSYQIYYNRDIFEKEGIPRPSEDWTWDEAMEIARKCTKRDARGVATQYGLTAQVDPFLTATVALGGSVLDESGKRCALDSPEALKALKFCLDLRNRLRVMPTLLEERTASTINLFQGGKVAMHIVGPWVIPELKTAKFKWDCLPYPKFSGRKRFSQMGVNAFVVSPQSKHPKEAYEFAKFASQIEAQKAMVKLQMNLPVIKKLLNAPDSDPDSPKGRSDRIVRQSLEYSRRVLTMAGNKQIEGKISKSREEAYLGIKTPEQALQAMVADINEILEKK